MKIIISILKKLSAVQRSKQNNNRIALYQVIEVAEENEEFIATIRVRNKNIIFKMKPEEVLANDSLVDLFSPRDIRALTYLGYLGINTPKFAILAQKLSQNEKIVFLLKKRGEKKIITKTADQIIKENNIISNMNSEDAKTIGFAVASEAAADEKKQKKQLLLEHTDLENQNF